MSRSSPLAAERSGLYRAPAAPDRLREKAEASGAAWLAADLTPVRTKAGLLRTIADAGGFPRTFGSNWDALSDSLQDFSWRPASGYVLHLTGAGSAAQALGPDWATFLEILGQAADYWKGREKPFVVLIDAARELPAFQ